MMLTKAEGAVTLYDPEDTTGTTALTTVAVGASWDSPTKDNSLKGRFKAFQRKAEGAAHPGDLDVFAFFLVNGDPKKYLGMGNNDCFAEESEPGANGSATHSGDSEDGAGSGDDEVVTVCLDRLPSRIDRVIFAAGAFKVGTSMNNVTNVAARFYDRSVSPTGPAQLTVEPPLLHDKNMLALSELVRVPGTKKFDYRAMDTAFDVRQGDLRDLLRKVMSL